MNCACSLPSEGDIFEPEPDSIFAESYLGMMAIKDRVMP